MNEFSLPSIYEQNEKQRKNPLEELLGVERDRLVLKGWRGWLPITVKRFVHINIFHVMLGGSCEWLFVS